MTQSEPRTRPLPFDTLAAYEEMQAAGLEPDAARAVVETIARAHANKGVTRADLREMEHRLDTRIGGLENKLDQSEARNRIGVSAIRREGADIRADLGHRISRVTWIMALLAALALALAVLWQTYAGEVFRLIAGSAP